MPNLKLFLKIYKESRSLSVSISHTMANLPYMPDSHFIDVRDLCSSVRPSSSWPLSSSRTTRPSVSYPALIPFRQRDLVHPELRVLVLVCSCCRVVCSIRPDPLTHPVRPVPTAGIALLFVCLCSSCACARPMLVPCLCCRALVLSRACALVLVCFLVCLCAPSRLSGGWLRGWLAASVAGRFGGWPLQWLAASASVCDVPPGG